MTQYRFSVMVVLLSGSWATADPPQTPDQLLAAIRGGQTQLTETEQSATGYRCQYDYTSPLAKAESHRVVQVRRRGDIVLLETEKVRPTGVVKMCLNDNHTFGVMQTEGRPEWSLLLFSRAERENDFRKNIGVSLPAAFPLTWCIEGTIYDFIKLPGFRITALRPVAGDRIEASVVVEDWGKKRTTLKGSMLFAQNHSYLLEKFEYSFANDSNSRFLNSRALGEHRPVRCDLYRELILDAATGAEQYKTDFRYSDYTLEPVDPAVFTLEHYGIPTPTSHRVPLHSRWPFWAAVATVGGGLAVLFRWLARRSRDRT